MRVACAPWCEYALLLVASMLLAAPIEATEGPDDAQPLDCVIEPHVLVDVSSSEIGVLGEVRVDEADVVREGDVIAALRTDVEQAELELSRARAEAVAEIALLRRDYEFNSRKRDRIDKLDSQRAVSAQSVDEVRTEQDLARLRVRAAEEKQRTAKLQATRDALVLKRRTILSPINGVVVQRYKAAGEYVEGDPIVQLVQLDPLRVEIVAPISMYGQISVGMKATVVPELALNGEFVAAVTSIDPIMDAATATFGVRLSMPNPEHQLPPGLKCTLVLQTQEENETMAEENGPQRVPVNEPGESVSAALSVDPEPGVPVTVSPRPAPVVETSKAPAPRDVVAASEPAPNAVPEPMPLAADVVTPHQAPPPTVATSVAGARPGECATLGPFAGESQAESVGAQLSANNVAFQHRRVSRDKVAGGHWIVLSSDVLPSPSKTLERIKQARITDYQLLTRGDWKGRISYGTYRGDQSAQNRLAKIRSLGLDATLERRTSQNQQIWLDLPRTHSDPAIARVMTSVRKNHPAVKVQSIPCPQLASR